MTTPALLQPGWRDTVRSINGVDLHIVEAGRKGDPLLVLLHAPIGANAKPELPALQEAGLVEMVKLDTETAPSFRLTEDGTAVLKGLGYR